MPDLEIPDELADDESIILCSNCKRVLTDELRDFETHIGGVAVQWVSACCSAPLVSAHQEPAGE